MEEAITGLTQALQQAESKAFPVKTQRTKSGKNSRAYYPELAQAISRSKLAHHKWKEGGEPSRDHPLTIERRKASSNVRRVQRKKEEENKRKLYDDILAAHEKDQATFYRLLQRKHGPYANSVALCIDGELNFNADEQRVGWAQFYKNLATPAPDSGNKPILDCIRSTSSKDIICITATQVESAVGRLNNGKAADLGGLQAEHFKLGGSTVVEALTAIINRLFQHRFIPDTLKMGYKIPIPKKGKDVTQMGNYRGITITATLGKIIEHILQETSKPALGQLTSGLQFGFTAGRSPSMATLCLTEVIANAKDLKEPLYVATLDAQKAFDVVCHDKLKLKLFHAGVRNTNWLMIDSLYTDCKEVVRWQGNYSDPYNVHQGVRQGGVLSTCLYKEYVNPLLIDTQKSNLGVSIGNIYLGIPTCADDVLLLSSSESELQSMLNQAYNYSKENHYKLHPGKSTVTQLLGPNCQSKQLRAKLGEEEVITTSSFTHLGLNWAQGNSCPDIERKIATGRRTAYMLIGSGIHGTNGMNPVISCQVMLTQVLPRMTYGLEATVQKDKDITKLNRAHKDLLRQYQSLPDRVATEAIFLLAGAFPASTYIEYKSLLLYGAICRMEENHPLRDLARRQLTLPDHASSWFVHVRKLAIRLGIDLLKPQSHPWDSLAWKKYIREAVFGTQFSQLINEASQKSSLKLLDLSLLDGGKPHILWKTSIYSIEETRKAAIRAKLLTGTYILQATQKKFGKSTTSICFLCGLEEEDVAHFITRCPELRETRDTWTPKINNLLTQAGICTNTQLALQWVKIVLNGACGGVLREDMWCKNFSYVCNGFIYNMINMHKARDIKLSSKSLLR